MKNILITGASGYVGTRLANHLLSKYPNLKIVNYDISFFGDSHLPKNKNYLYVKNDLRDQIALKKTIKDNKISTILHLACISNDPTFELNTRISKEINFDCFEPLVKISKECGVQKFIYASTCSVYGLSNEPEVKEDHPLVPLTDYNKYKAMCEPVLKSYSDNNFNTVIIRPATVCGFSEKMRFDLSVNILTNYAYNKGYIKVFGGNQTRPNIHIDDMCLLYDQLINMDISGINGQVFNAGNENLEIIKIAELVRLQMKEIMKKEVKLQIEKSDDPRSYRINSDKLKKILNFKFKKNVKNAIEDLIIKFKNNDIKDSFSDEWKNISVLKKLEIDKKYI